LRHEKMYRYTCSWCGISTESPWHQDKDPAYKEAEATWNKTGRVTI